MKLVFGFMSIAGFFVYDTLAVDGLPQRMTDECVWSTTANDPDYQERLWVSLLFMWFSVYSRRRNFKFRIDTSLQLLAATTTNSEKMQQLRYLWNERHFLDAE